MTSGTVRIVVGGLLAAGLTMGLGALSQVPYETLTAENAVIRLAWRIRGVRVEECRRVTAEELERLPVHMRREEICEGRILPYRLRVLLDGTLVTEELVRAAGAREDRPLYVSRDFPVDPGDYNLYVEFLRQGEPPADASAADVTPAMLVLDRRVTLGAKDVALVTYDAGERRLMLVGEDDPPGR